MSRGYGLSFGWKLFWAILTFLLVAGVVFCLVAVILAEKNGVTFAEEVKSWFGVVKETVSATKILIK